MVRSHLWFPPTTFCGAAVAVSLTTLQNLRLQFGKCCFFFFFLPFSLCHTSLVFCIPVICPSSLWKTDSPPEPRWSSLSWLRRITDVLMEWSNWIMVPGNEFSTFWSETALSQTDTYYLLKDPEGRSCQLHATQLSKPMGEKKKKKSNNCHFYCRSLRTRQHVCLYVCDRKRRGERERERLKWNNPPLMSNQIGTFLPFHTV